MPNKFGEYIVPAYTWNDEQTAIEKGYTEVIRCKDCKNSDPWYADERRCFLWSENGISVFDDGFCNYAERKE